jgi:hypothetical protein
MIGATVSPESANVIDDIIAELPNDKGTNLVPMIRNGKLIRVPANLPGVDQGRPVPLMSGGRLLKSTGREVG